jgi:Amidase
VNLAGPALRAVIELNPSALAQAAALDAERKTKGPRGPLHGIPIILKDNIATLASDGDFLSFPAIVPTSTHASLIPRHEHDCWSVFLYSLLQQYLANQMTFAKVRLRSWARSPHAMPQLLLNCALPGQSCWAKQTFRSGRTTGVLFPVDSRDVEDRQLALTTPWPIRLARVPAALFALPSVSLLPLLVLRRMAPSCRLLAGTTLWASSLRLA